MSEVPMTHLSPEATWADTISSIGDPTLGLIFFAGAILLGTLFMVANRPSWLPLPQERRPDRR